MSAQPLVHHELCFGCGRTNLFGLLMEVERTGPDSVRGRAFVKQDHQGSEPGSAHDGIVLTALSEAMAFATGSDTRVVWVELEVLAPVPVGSFLDVDAEVAPGMGSGMVAQATARVEDRAVASARGVYRRRQASDG